ncbi:MAG: anthranilate phosphoribosyltransferase [Chloroflexaceae bacterium]|nr:anthranilate phosphoribosyltransferase [Chloroflexaceae bacterium]
MVSDFQENEIASINWSELLQQLLDRQSLNQEQAARLMAGWLREELSGELSGAILAAIQAKGVSASELVGMARVLQAQSQLRSLLHHHAPAIDTCGTGGDGASTFNISTAAAFVAAPAGSNVAKHGNRSRLQQSGFGGCLEYLGINLATPLATSEAALETVGITFLFAPGWHPALKSVAPVRKALKIRTVFNLLGPLVNPLRPAGQVIGIYDPQFLVPMAQALQELGIAQGIVLHGREKLDEAGLAAATDLAIVGKGSLQLSELDPLELGIPRTPTSALKGGDIPENAEILQAVLQGKGSSAQQDAVALNASLALQVGGIVPTGHHQEGLEKAREILKSGMPWLKLEELVRFLAQ